MHDVAIVGAGVAGLAAAIALSRIGLKVIIYERFREPEAVGSGLLLQPIGLAALERLGVRGAAEACGARIERLYGRTVDGIPIFDLSYRDLADHSCGVGIHRAALHGVLWDAFTTSGAEIETGLTIALAEQDATGRVRPVTESGQRLAPVRFLVDCSGANSEVAAQLSGKSPKPFAYGAVWATVPDTADVQQMLSQRYHQASRMMGYLPIGAVVPGGEAKAALFWSLKVADYERWVNAFANWQIEAIRFWPEMADVINALSGPHDFSLARYGQFTQRVPYFGAAISIGDAAHSTSPQLGQGANHGLLDAVLLADALEKYPDVSVAFAAFARKRRSHVRFYQWASALLTPMFQSDSRFFPWLRDKSIYRMEQVPYLKREMLRTLAGLKTGAFTWSDETALAHLTDVRELALSPAG